MSTKSRRQRRDFSVNAIIDARRVRVRVCACEQRVAKRARHSEFTRARIMRAQAACEHTNRFRMGFVSEYYYVLYIVLGFILLGLRFPVEYRVSVPQQSEKYETVARLKPIDTAVVEYISLIHCMLQPRYHYAGKPFN